MNTTVEELKALYVKMGGTASDVANISTIPDMIAALTTVAGAGDLPHVSETDEGKFLAVSNGAWDKVDAPSGGSKKYVTVNFSDGSGSTASAKTWTITDEATIQMIDDVVTNEDYENLIVVVNGLDSHFNVRHHFSSLFTDDPDPVQMCFASVYGGVNTFNGYACFCKLEKDTNNHYILDWRKQTIYED